MTNGTENMNAVDPNYVAPEPNPSRRITLGERRMRIDFNPATDFTHEYVNRIKRQSAELIDLIDGAAASPKFNEDEFNDWVRLKELAITAIEEGGSWGVKSATIIR